VLPLRLAAGASEAVLARLGGVWPAVSQGRVVAEVAHRPWPLPAGSWLMAQTWEDLLFAHWPLPAGELASFLPAPLELDTFDGSAWLGITPFEVSGLRLRGTPPAPLLSRFPELNVRTYATLDGKPGIWFFSLDAGSVAAVAAARRTYRLPYFRAAMRIRRDGGGIGYRSARRGAHLEAAYAPVGAPRPPAAGTLEHWLTERYCLYTVADGRVLRGQIHHPPWPLQDATARVRINTMAPVALPEREPLLHFARRQDVVIWPPEPAA
jgi:uncharacterized protein YqjF (DUF2071 family)